MSQVVHEALLGGGGVGSVHDDARQHTRSIPPLDSREKKDGLAPKMGEGEKRERRGGPVFLGGCM